MKDEYFLKPALGRSNQYHAYLLTSNQIEFNVSSINTRIMEKMKKKKKLKRVIETENWSRPSIIGMLTKY